MRILKVRPEVGEAVSTVALWAKGGPGRDTSKINIQDLTVEGSGVSEEQQRNELGDGS